MSDIDLLLNKHNYKFIAKKIAENLKKNRISQNFTQVELSERSGVTLSSLKRFEQKAEISLSNLLKLAIALDSINNFEKLFSKIQPNTLDDFIEKQKSKEKQRVRK